MSRRRRSTLAPSLFPFLAVLVCTLGTLILLLALVAQNATDAAEQQARAEQVRAQQAAQKSTEDSQQLTAAVVREMLEEETFRATELVAMRDQQTADVEERRDKLTHLEDHIQRIRKQLKRLSDEIDQASGDVITNVADHAAIEALQGQLQRERIAISKLKTESRSKQPRIVIVPHDGPNGTERRPIYVECTAQGATIWPEGTTITRVQLSDAAPQANPLDAALRAIRYHALQTYGEETPPYPLLVVRPDGIETYAAARRAMQDWDEQFGYELVPANVKLAYNKPDPNLKQRIEIAVREAAAVQHALSSMARRARAGQQQRLPPRRTKLPILSAAELDRSGRTNGYRSGNDRQSLAGTSPYVSSSSRFSRSAAFANSQTAQGSRGGYRGGSPTPTADATAIRELDQNLLEAAAMQRQRSASSSGSRLNPYGGLAPPTTADSGDPRGSDPSANVARPTPSAELGSGASPATAGGDNSSAPGFASATSAGRAEENLVEGEGRSQQDAPGERETVAAESMENADAGGPQGSTNSGQARVDGGTMAVGGSPMAQNQSAPAQAQASSSDISGSSGQPPPEMAQAPPPQINVSPALQELVKRQGRDWALPRSLVGVGGNKIVRTIRVQCYEDRFVLLPPSTGGPTEMFGFSDGEVNRATLQLATAVRNRIARWGTALPGGRWQPRLDVEVMPAGDTRFHQLRTLMRDSGVEVTGRAAP